MWASRLNRNLAISVAPIGAAALYMGTRAKTPQCDAYRSSVQQYILSSVKDNQIVMFSKTQCGYCVKAKKILNDMGLKFLLIELDVRSIHVSCAILIVCVWPCAEN